MEKTQMSDTPRVALLTIPTGDISIEDVGVVEHAVHGRRGARVPA